MDLDISNLMSIPDKLMSQYVSIHNMVSFYVASFLWRDQNREKSFKVIGNGFRYDLWDDITHGDRSKFIKVRGVVYFGDHSDNSRIKTLENPL